MVQIVCSAAAEQGHVDDEGAIALWQQSFLSLQQEPGSIQENVIRHQFTHYSLDISVAVIELEHFPRKIADSDNYHWVSVSALDDHGLPTPVRNLLGRLQTNS